MVCLLNVFKQSPSIFSYFIFTSFLILIILGTSCDKDKSFGLEIQPESQTLGAFLVDTFVLHTSTVISDSIKTDELNGSSPLGNYIDPIFGEVNSSIYTHVRLAQGYDFRPDNGSLDSIVVDSVVLYLAIDGSYGNIEKQTFLIEQIDEEMHIDSSYYSSTALNTLQTDLSAGLSLSADPLMPGQFAGEYVSESILRIPLSINDFAWPIINESGNTTLDGNDEDDEFLDWFKGMKISSPIGNNGGLYYIDLLSSYSKIRLFYRDTSGVIAEHDTLSFDFNINSNCAFYHQVEHNYNNTPIENALNFPSEGQDQFYVQSLGGVLGVFTIPELDSLKSQNVIINKAEVIIPFEDYVYDEYNAPSFLLLSRKNDSAEYDFLPDFFEGKLGGGYNSVNKNYTFNITRHVNEIIADVISNDTIRVIPTGNGISANRIILNGIESSKKGKSKVVITYTKY